MESAPGSAGHGPANRVVGPCCFLLVVEVVVLVCLALRPPHRAGWAHAKISLVFGRTDASAFLADRCFTCHCCPEFDFTQIGRVPDNFGRPSRVAAAKMMVVSTQIRPHRAV